MICDEIGVDDDVVVRAEKDVLFDYLYESHPTTSRKASMATCSTSSNQKSFKYHVFLSFRGEDTRNTFVDHLYASLTRLGIHTFRDNEELEKGKQIESRFFIIVFSKNYASSSWCLKEITKIMDGPVGRAIAKHKTNEQIKIWKKALEGAGNLVGWDLKNITNGYKFLHCISTKLFFDICISNRGPARDD
ncbi:hypothetical protein LXL04_010617 [Taraxacum kok-saghyz]